MAGGVMQALAQRSAKLWRKQDQNIQLKENLMYLYLREKIRSLGDDEQQFFRTAYMWRFGKDADVSTDVCQYRLHAIIPPYVQNYVCYLQAREAMEKK